MVRILLVRPIACRYNVSRACGASYDCVVGWLRGRDESTGLNLADVRVFRGQMPSSAHAWLVLTRLEDDSSELPSD